MLIWQSLQHIVFTFLVVVYKGTDIYFLKRLVETAAFGN